MKTWKGFLLAAILLPVSALPALGVEQDYPYPVQLEEKKHVYRDREGKDPFGKTYERACAFAGDIAAVKMNDLWGFIDRKGKVVLPFEYEAVAPTGAQSRRVPEEDQCGAFTGEVAVVKKRGKWGVIDRSGRFLVEPDYFGFIFGAYTLAPDNTLLPSREGSWFLSMVEKYVPRPEDPGRGAPNWNLVRQSDVIVSLKDGKPERIFRNPDPERIVPIRRSATGLRKIMIREKLGFEGPDGKLVVPTVFIDAGDYSEEMARVNDSGKWGFLDNTGKMAIAPRFLNATDFSEGLAAVQVGNNWGYIDRTGNVVIEPRYQFCYPFKGDKARVLLWSGTFRYIDRKGEYLP